MGDVSKLPGKRLDGRTAPAHLSENSRGFWRSILEVWQLDDPVALELLCRACEARDRLDAARVLLDREGLTTTDRYGQIKPHPAATIETAARIALSRLLRELRLDDPPEDPRPPRGRGRTS